ncbi:oxygenase MpaB family protein [Aspergillus lucknowensis]|uniref:ER-bound oxygenase mpaB/mpaB'/Rubber oxygenase catalytic domain-containing protein n=1 Tax=Aspergillus lucknowensis TaxID=176173 RepID=A0ABR4M294_9EURO
MSLDEKAHGDRVSPVSSFSTETPPKPTRATTDPNALDNLQVLPKILQEGILFIASGPALLLQAAQPALKRRLSQTAPNTSSPTLADDLTTTLRSTLSYIACLVFGTREEKQALLGRLGLGQPPLPTTKLAVSPNTNDAEANEVVQLWLVATLYATATDIYQRIYGRIDYRTAERGYAEFALLLRHLDNVVLPAHLWPATRAEFWRYWDDELEGLSVSADAHKFAHDLATRTDLPRWVSMLKPVMRVVTVEMLPVRIREAYGLKSTMGTRGVYRTTMGFSVAVYPALPKNVRSWPVKYYLDEMRKHLAV